MILIDGKKIASELREDLKKEVYAKDKKIQKKYLNKISNLYIKY